MRDVLINIRPFLEALAFLATIAVAIGLLVARAQLSAFREDSLVRNRRLAKEKAIEASSRYLTQYIPLVNAFFTHMENNKLPLHKWTIGDFCFASMSKEDTKAAIKFMGISEILPHMNELEVIASILVSDVGDEKTAFCIIGRSYCDNIRQFYGFIAGCRRMNEGQPYWYNMVSLYRLWAPRLAKEELTADANHIQRILSTLPET